KQKAEDQKALREALSKLDNMDKLAKNYKIAMEQAHKELSELESKYNSVVAENEKLKIQLKEIKEKEPTVKVVEKTIIVEKEVEKKVDKKEEEKTEEKKEEKPE